MESKVMLKSCCVTGHSNIPANHVDCVKEKLHKQIFLAIQDGFSHFISGFASGVDLYFASIVADIKKKNTEITLEAAIPFRERLETKEKDFHESLNYCDKISIVSETFHQYCYIERYMYMVNHSQRVIAVYDGRESGGTAFTILYAQTVNRELHIIKV